MALSAQDVVRIFQQELDLLSGLDENIDENEIAIAVDAWDLADEFQIPRTLQHPNTPVGELGRADWADAKELADEVVPYLDQLCAFWERVYAAHASAIECFRAAANGRAPYCLYLRNFAHVVRSDDDDPDVRVALYHITTGLDLALQLGLAKARPAINTVSCLHTDDFGLSVGESTVPAIRVHGHNWQGPIVEAIRGAKVIVFYVGASSAGTAIELDEIRQAKLQDRTILVYEEKAHLPSDSGKFASALSVAEFLTSPTQPLTAVLTANAKKRLTELMGDAFKAPAPAKALLELRCAVVDPDLTKELPGTVNQFNVLCVTPANLSAFACYVVGFPEAVRAWETIAIQRKSAHAKALVNDVDDLQSRANYAWGGAVAMGLTSSIAAATGLRVVFANLRPLKGAKAKAQRKAASLDVLAIAARFDALTMNHQWRDQIEEWTSMIESDSLPRP